MLPSRLISIAVLLVLVGFKAMAKDVYVFDAKRPLSMSQDHMNPKDYYINAGTESGLKPNVIVAVTRRQSLYDPYQNKAAGDILVLVAEVRIVYAQDGLSVARLEKMFERAALPVLDIDGIMIGDRLDLGSARMPSKKSAEAPEAEPATAKQEQVVFGPQLPEKVSESADFSSVTVNSQTM